MLAAAWLYHLHHHGLPTMQYCILYAVILFSAAAVCVCVCLSLSADPENGESEQCSKDLISWGTR